MWCPICDRVELERPRKIMTTNDIEKKTLLKAFKLFVNWAIDNGFGYDDIPDQYLKHKDKLDDMWLSDGLMWISYWEAEKENK